ncbi:hypothetical protein M5W68_16310 [Paenibacillus larvae]|uniref:hypothetical protein n=1 Tax=Paenibacillus larvae TaxID=1464 RepID=UPI0022827AB6|nr:hypothetical protein [Paenibacillus larvae]MCY9512128.1 hypothetical protein [Paenibacillus larvae]MCY9526634.1 hypothetical protein [Paenibacillus larvae]
MNDRIAFNEAVTELIAENITDRSERIKAVEALTDAYIDSVGQAPDSAQLERLADYLLLEELNDNSADKVTQTEYPVFSDRQLERRYKKETTVKAAEYIGMDGRNHKAGKRRKRNKWETSFIDKNAKIRNAERKAQYRKDTAPSHVFTYYI